MLVFRTVTSPLRLYASGGHSVSCPMANVHTRASDSYSSFLHASIPRLLPCMSVCGRTVRRFCLSLMTCAVRAALWFALLSDFTLAVACMLLLSRLLSSVYFCLFLTQLLRHPLSEYSKHCQGDLSSAAAGMPSIGPAACWRRSSIGRRSGSFCLVSAEPS